MPADGRTGMHGRPKRIGGQLRRESPDTAAAHLDRTVWPRRPSFLRTAASPVGLNTITEIDNDRSFSVTLYAEGFREVGWGGQPEVLFEKLQPLSRFVRVATCIQPRTRNDPAIGQQRIRPHLPFAVDKLPNLPDPWQADLVPPQLWRSGRRGRREPQNSAATINP